MGFRFRKSIGICPSNIEKHSLSSVGGVRGDYLSLGHQSTHANIGLLETGVSYRTKLSLNSRASKQFSTSKNVTNHPSTELVSFVEVTESEMSNIVNTHFSSSPILLNIIRAVGSYIHREEM
ncbi:DUF4236 domain-containing protein [Vibrio owensii]|uniref:DUF4236 domain-containing protein n=1 Tax=Vibrio owensii TaxID=696485 RepID=UPI0038CF3FA5